MFNNGPVVLHLANCLQEPKPPTSGSSRERIIPEPCLLVRLPTTAFLQREAEILAPKAIIRQLRRSPSPSPSSNDNDSHAEHEEEEEEEGEEGEEPPERTRRSSLTSILSNISSATSNSAKSLVSRRKEAKPWKEPEPYEVFRAIERKDLMFLMEIRDRSFHLLLRKAGDATPLLHAMRIGHSHQDVAVFLLGTFSRYINNLQDEEIVLPRTKMLLKALRINLKLAIDFGLQSSQSDLIASFLQTLVMSEGERWIGAQASNITLSLRAGTEGQPVKTAENAVRSFATKELGKTKAIATLEDYIANATADLLMIAAWSCALDSIPGEQIPFYYFARDDRVYKAFIDRLDKYKRTIERTLSKRLKWQLRVLRKVMEGRSTSYRSKVETLAEEFDHGEGV